MGADDKLHQRAKAPNRRRSKNVQPLYRGFEPVGQPRISLVVDDGAGMFCIEEIVLGDVHPVAGSDENVVEVSFAAIIEPDFDAVSLRSGGHHSPSEMHRHIFQTVHEPASTGGPDRSLAQPVLNRPRELPHQIRPCHDLADACGPYVRRLIENFRYRMTEATVNCPRHDSPKPAYFTGAGDDLDIGAGFV